MNQKYLLLITIFSLLIGCAQKPVEPEIQDDRKKPAFGIKLAPQPICFDKALANGSRCGFKMEVVFPFAAASKAGLETNDILIGFQGEIFGSLKPSDVNDFVARLGKMKLGEPVEMIVLRKSQMASYQIGQEKPVKLQAGELPPLEKMQKDNAPELSARWTQTEEIKKFQFKVEGRIWHYGDQDIRDYSATHLPKDSVFHKKLEDMIAQSPKSKDLKADVDDLRLRLKDLNLLVDERRLPVVAYLQNNPERIQDVQNMHLKLAQGCKNVWRGCLVDLVSSSGIQVEPSKELKITPTVTPTAYLELAAKVYQLSLTYFEQALTKLSADERAYLQAHALEMTEKFSEQIYLHEDDNKFRLQRDLKMMQIMQKIDLTHLARSLLPYEQLLKDASVLEKLKKHPDAKNEFVASLKTPGGTFLMGGTGNNKYYAAASNTDAVFILDLGGDDYYPDVSANIIDLEGNDLYEASMPWTLSSGFLRTRILIDQGGNDIYQCGNGCLGSSLFGASLHYDMDGNDTYNSQQYAIGVAWTGVSLFVDSKGNDTYRSTMLSQGVGIAGGIGLLMDFGGSDSYFSKGASPSPYRDPGQFSGWSQGVGLGLRNFVSGGWGLLFDDGGPTNRFESGTFSQGGGYYFGLGSLINAGSSNDLYLGARYSQGFSAHSAIGNFLDVNGNDSYLSPSDVGEGMAWDLGLSLFEDQNGNDQYQACAHCLGMGSQNSIAFFIDRAGKDIYRGKDLPFAGKHYNDYHGGKSFGLFWDLGGAQDQYMFFKNNDTRTVNEWQILKDE